MYKFNPNKQAVLEFLFISLILVLVSLVVSKISFYNGRIDMCNEMGKVLTLENGCVECEDTGRIWYEGECIIPTVQHNIMRGYNGSIL